MCDQRRRRQRAEDASVPNDLKIKTPEVKVTNSRGEIKKVEPHQGHVNQLI